jgi:hypothetical protein
VVHLAGMVLWHSAVNRKRNKRSTEHTMLLRARETAGNCHLERSAWKYGRFSHSLKRGVERSRE